MENLQGSQALGTKAEELCTKEEQDEGQSQKLEGKGA